MFSIYGEIMMQPCYLPHCTNETTDSSGLCTACLQKCWQDHVRESELGRGDIPAANVERWGFKPDEYWYWSAEGCWKLSDRDPRALPDFAGWERPADAVPAASIDVDLPGDLAAIVCDQLIEIAHLRADKALLESTVANLMAEPGIRLSNN